MIEALILGSMAAAGAARANSAASRSVDRAHDFSERMSNTAYQRAMADMRTAGLNPILAAKLGGASTPTGTTYTPQNIGAAFGQGFSQGSSAMQSQAQTKKIKAETQNIEKIGRKIEAEIENIGAKTGLTNEQIAKVKEETDAVFVKTKMARADMEQMQRIGQWLEPMAKKLGIPTGMNNWLGPKTMDAIFTGIDKALRLGELTSKEIRNWLLSIIRKRGLVIQ